MPYAIEFESKVTGETDVGPALIIKIEKPLKPVKERYMTKKEAEEFCDMVNDDSTYNNADHRVVKI